MPRQFGNFAIFANKFAPKVLGIVETQINKARVEALAPSLGFDSCFAVNSSGRSGGLGLFWNNEIKLEILSYSHYHIDAKVEGLGTNVWRLTLVYGEAQVTERFKTWDTLKDIALHSSLPWAVLGDFNEVLNHGEYERIGSRSNLQIEGFREVVDICALQDLGYRGNFWTFEKKVVGGTYTRVRLDRGLVTPDWNLLFPNSCVIHHTSACSDHSMIQLVLDETEEGKSRNSKPFCYEAMWESHAELGKTIADAWLNSLGGSSVSDFRCERQITLLG